MVNNVGGEKSITVITQIGDVSQINPKETDISQFTLKNKFALSLATKIKTISHLFGGSMFSSFLRIRNKKRISKSAFWHSGPRLQHFDLQFHQEMLDNRSVRGIKTDRRITCGHWNWITCAHGQESAPRGPVVKFTLGCSPCIQTFLRKNDRKSRWAS